MVANVEKFLFHRGFYNNSSAAKMLLNSNMHAILFAGNNVLHLHTETSKIQLYRLNPFLLRNVQMHEILTLVKTSGVPCHILTV